MNKLLFTITTSLILLSCQSGNSKIENKNTTKIISLAKTQKMDSVFFWQIMDNAFTKGKFDNQVREQAILDELIKLTPEQIQEFEIIFQQMNLKSSTWKNFAAQTIIEGGSSDDRFFYFRCWLISLGKHNFEETVKNPDYLATLDIPINKEYNMMYCQFEELIPMSDRAYAVVTKKNPAVDTTFPRTHAEKLGLFYDSGTNMTGSEWGYDDLIKIAPLLYKKYPEK